ncbi:MAG: DUF4131 domain-containing protein [Chloroflexota bacterium]|nr:DUF4131 domain-containing protein [Chloroflexota bacterium]
MWLLYISCAWVAGIFLGSKVSLPLAILSIGLIPFAFIPLLPNARRNLIAAGLCLLSLLGGSLYFPSSLPKVDEHSLCYYNDRGTAEIQGMVSEEPDVTGRLCQLKLSANKITIEGDTKELSGNVLIKVTR